MAKWRSYGPQTATRSNCSRRAPRGRFSVSSVFGLIFLVHQTGSALGSWLAGSLFESTGGYGAAYALACAFLFCAGVTALKIDKGARRIWRAAPVSAN